ncbi:hypothetical protein BDP27DRAFT_1428891 [Rhodocollybia butyracea]|uniref:Uncharacterized protein n=1 Tax=Rhodocollybia butyracea TaxID=206335 RepID=A0A9P5PDS4_9AGAR|nr:hypothetical protein BDP27DRAFT_1428891 [Rhodocollybia butyracea]
MELELKQWCASNCHQLVLQGECLKIMKQFTKVAWENANEEELRLVREKLSELKEAKEEVKKAEELDEKGEGRLSAAIAQLKEAIANVQYLDGPALTKYHQGRNSLGKAFYEAYPGFVPNVIHPMRDVAKGVLDSAISLKKMATNGNIKATPESIQAVLQGVVSADLKAVSHTADTT